MPEQPARKSSKPDASVHAKPQVFAGVRAVKPGQTIDVAVSFDIDDEWYMYWPGQNDSGIPALLTWRLPDGAKAGATRWPAPERKVLDGDLLDYVFHKRLTLVTPITIPADASGEVEISVDLEWLACKDVCLPGSTALTMTLPVGESAPVKAGEADASRYRAMLIEDAKRSWPQALPAYDKDFITSWKDGELVFVVQGAKRMTFAPLELGAKLLDPLKAGTNAGSSLRLKFQAVKPEPGLPMTAEQGNRARGVLQVEKAGGAVTNYEVDLPLPTAEKGIAVPGAGESSGANNGK